MSAEPETPVEADSFDPVETTGEPVAEPSDAELRSREAAGYRTRLREAERQVGERDEVIAGLRGELDRLHRAEAERLATVEGMAVPADLWTLHGVEELRDDDGRLDAERVASTVRDVLSARPTWRLERPDLGAGPRGGARPQPGLSALLKGGRR